MKNALMLLVVTTLLLGACASSPLAPASYEYEMPLGGASDFVEERAGAPAIAMESDAMPMATAVYYDTSTANTGQQRMVIQNANLSLVVQDPKNSLEAITALATRLGGFVVSSNLYQNYSASGEPIPAGTLTIRVPAERLEEALAEIKAGAVEIQSENRSGQDVTQQYTDLASRLKNLEAAEAELQELMTRAEDPEDVIAVFNQLVYYREQIEVTKGQMQYFEQSAALSAITIQLTAEETIQPIEVAGWRPEGVARDAIQALVNFFQGFVDFMIWLVLFILPSFTLMLLPFLLVFLVIRAWWKRRKDKKADPAPEKK